MKLVFATNNPHKLKEVREILSDSVQIISLEDLNCFEEIAETEPTLEGNAKLKVNYITQNYGYDCFADDTGLEVEALDGKPGVFSSRYAGKNGNAEKNIRKLLSELEGQQNRNAQFRTVIALNLKRKCHLFEGICQGEILKEKTGTNGFGYDPIFKPTMATHSFANLRAEEKNKISHRGIAIQKLVQFLNSL